LSGAEPMKSSTVTGARSMSAWLASAVACNAHMGSPSTSATALTSQPGKRHQPAEVRRTVLIDASSTAQANPTSTTASGIASSRSSYPFGPFSRVSAVRADDEPKGN